MRESMRLVQKHLKEEIVAYVRDGSLPEAKRLIGVLEALGSGDVRSDTAPSLTKYNIESTWPKLSDWPEATDSSALPGLSMVEKTLLADGDKLGAIVAFRKRMKEAGRLVGIHDAKDHVEAHLAATTSIKVT